VFGNEATKFDGVGDAPPAPSIEEGGVSQQELEHEYAPI
jgi:hypothetical protein